MAPRVLVLCFFTATALLAACGGGGGVTPAGNSTPTPKPSASATATPTPSSTATPTPATSGAAFTGGSSTQSFTSSGGTISTSADGGYTASVTFGANNAPSAYNMTMSWATYAQITGTFAPGALPASIGTALVYLDFKSASTVDFNQTPAVTGTASGSFPGTKCGFAVYGSPGSGSSQKAWFSMTAVGISEVSPSGNSFSVPPASLGAGSNVQFDTSDQYLALYCH